MVRILISGLLVLGTASVATAQTTPTRSGTKNSAATQKNTTAQSSAKTTAPPAPRGTKNLGPAGNGAAGSTESADGKGQNIYAAPGMPVNVDNPKKVEGYNGPAPTNRTRTRTTLTPTSR